jgi:DNA-binding GntR family transcriptional regulator
VAKVSAGTIAAGAGSMEYRTKEEQVADYLREGVISGRFARGSRVKQAEIAELLETSITPVREAFRMLEAQGYLTGSSYRGVTVVDFDPGASEEVLQLRLLLESELIRHAVANVTDEDVAELEELARDFARTSAAPTSTETRAANYRFHRRLYELARQPQTLQFVEILWARYPFDLINEIAGRTSRAAAEHKQILRHVGKRNADGAVTAARRHIAAGWKELHRG